MKKDLVKIIMNAIAKNPSIPADGACCFPSATQGRTACLYTTKEQCDKRKNSTFHHGVTCKDRSISCFNSGPVPA